MRKLFSLDTESSVPSDLDIVTQRDERVDALLATLTRLATRPDVFNIFPLEEEEWRILNEKWNDIDVAAKRASFKFRRGVDVDHALASQAWNPQGRVLSLEERAEFAVQLRNLHFFSRISRWEALNSTILPGPLPSAERTRICMVELNGTSDSRFSAISVHVLSNELVSNQSIWAQKTPSFVTSMKKWSSSPKTRK